MIELTKSQKKIARQLINLALQRECEDFLNKVQSFLHEVESSGMEYLVLDTCSLFLIFIVQEY